MIVECGKYYLYRHIRLDTNEVFYVGVGTKRKHKISDKISAYARAFNSDSRNKYWRNIVKKTAYSVEIILESNDKGFMASKEKEFISLYGRKYLGDGTLVNMEEGGWDNFRRPTEIISRCIQTKKINGTAGNAKNLINWINSEKYKNPKSRAIHVYCAKNGALLHSFESIQKCADFLGLKGSVSYVIEACDTRKVYRSSYLFSWEYRGAEIDLSNYNLIDVFYRAVVRVCPTTKKMLTTYRSMSEAAKANDTTLRNISEAVMERGSTAGYFWILESEASNIASIRFKKFKTPGVVRIDEKGSIEFFNGTRAAAKASGVHKSSVLRSIHNNESLRGYDFKFGLNKTQS